MTKNNSKNRKCKKGCKIPPPIGYVKQISKVVDIEKIIFENIFNSQYYLDAKKYHDRIMSFFIEYQLWGFSDILYNDYRLFYYNLYILDTTFELSERSWCELHLRLRLIPDIKQVLKFVVKFQDTYKNGNHNNFITWMVDKIFKFRTTTTRQIVSIYFNVSLKRIKLNKNLNTFGIFFDIITKDMDFYELHEGITLHYALLYTSDDYFKTILDKGFRYGNNIVVCSEGKVISFEKLRLIFTTHNINKSMLNNMKYLLYSNKLSTIYGYGIHGYNLDVISKIEHFLTFMGAENNDIPSLHQLCQRQLIRNGTHTFHQVDDNYYEVLFI